MTRQIQLFARYCRTDKGWQTKFLSISQRVFIDGEQLFPYGLLINGRNHTVYVQKYVLSWDSEVIRKELMSVEEIV